MMKMCGLLLVYLTWDLQINRIRTPAPTKTYHSRKVFLSVCHALIHNRRLILQYVSLHLVRQDSPLWRFTTNRIPTGERSRRTFIQAPEMTVSI